MFGFGGAQQRKRKDARKGKDIRLDLEITLEEAFRGVEKEFTISRYDRCPRCSGKGAEPGTKTVECFSCRGTGQVQQIRKQSSDHLPVTQPVPNAAVMATVSKNHAMFAKAKAVLKAIGLFAYQYPQAWITIR